MSSNPITVTVYAPASDFSTPLGTIDTCISAKAWLKYNSVSGGYIIIPGDDAAARALLVNGRWVRVEVDNSAAPGGSVSLGTFMVRKRNKRSNSGEAATVMFGGPDLLHDLGRTIIQTAVIDDGSAAAQAGYPGPYPGPATPTAAATMPPAATATATPTITPYPTRTPQATPHYTAVKLQSFSAERINKWP